MTLSLIVAMSDNRVIGNNGQLPWRLSADLKRFKRLTMGHHIIMGRKTFESIGRLLPGRTTVVITRQKDYDAKGALVAHDLDEAIQLAKGDDEAFIIGGAEIYRQAMSKVDRIFLTLVHCEVDGDTLLAEFEIDQWTRTSEERHSSDEKNQFDYSFLVYQRKQSESLTN